MFCVFSLIINSVKHVKQNFTQCSVSNNRLVTPPCSIYFPNPTGYLTIKSAFIPCDDTLYNAISLSTVKDGVNKSN